MEPQPITVKLLYPLKFLFDKKTEEQFQLVVVPYQNKEVIRAQSLRDPNRIVNVKHEKKNGTTYYRLRFETQIDKRTGTGVKRNRPKDADGHNIYKGPHGKRLTDQEKVLNKELRHTKRRLANETKKRKEAERASDHMSFVLNNDGQEAVDPSVSTGKKKKRSPGTHITTSPNGTTVTLVASVNVSSNPRPSSSDDATRKYQLLVYIIIKYLSYYCTC